jgi:hypothetical protein
VEALKNPIRLTLLSETTTYRTEARSTGVPDWTWDDAAGALAMGGASDLEAAAFEYRWRRAGRCRHMLCAELMLEGLKAQDRHRWPARLDGRRYLEPMVQLALDCEMLPGLERLPRWWQVHLDWMPERQWDRVAYPMYKLVRQPLDIWHGEAMRKARNGLEDRDYGT